MPYARSFDKWLEEKAHEAVPVGDAMTMVSAATRANTFREIIGYLKNNDDRAHIALGD